MPLDDATGVVHWHKPVITRHSTEHAIKETKLEVEVAEEKTKKVVELVNRVAGRKAEGGVRSVLYVLNAFDAGAAAGSVVDGEETVCPECQKVLMAFALKGINDSVTVRHVRSNELLQQLSVTTHGAPWHRNRGEDELNLLRGVRKPNTKLPMLLSSDGTALCDSDQILQYLDNRYPEKKVFTDGAYEYGLAIKPLWGILKNWWEGRLLVAAEENPEEEQQQEEANAEEEGLDRPDAETQGEETNAEGQLDEEKQEIAAQLLIEEYMEGLDDLCSALPDDQYLLSTPTPSSIDCNLAPKLHQLKIIGESRGWVIPSKLRCLQAYMRRVFSHDAFLVRTNERPRLSPAVSLLASKVLDLVQAVASARLQATAPSAEAVLSSWEAGLHGDLPLEMVWDADDPRHHHHHHHFHLHHHHHRTPSPTQEADDDDVDRDGGLLCGCFRKRSKTPAIRAPAEESPTAEFQNPLETFDRDDGGVDVFEMDSKGRFQNPLETFDGEDSGVDVFEMDSKGMPL